MPSSPFRGENLSNQRPCSPAPPRPGQANQSSESNSFQFFLSFLQETTSLISFFIKSNMPDTAYSDYYGLKKVREASSRSSESPFFSLRKAGAGTNHPFPTSERASRQKGRTGAIPLVQARQRGEKSVPPRWLAQIVPERTGHGKGTRGPTQGREQSGTTFDAGPARLRSD